MLCTPALLYVILCSIQIIIDFIQGLYNTAFIKIGITIVMTIVLNLLCEIDLGIISWVIISTPFIIMALGTSIAMGLQLDRGMSTLMKEHFSSPEKDKKIESLGPGEPPEQSNPV